MSLLPLLSLLVMMLMTMIDSSVNLAILSD